MVFVRGLMVFIRWSNGFYPVPKPTGTPSNPWDTRLWRTWHDFCLLFI